MIAGQFLADVAAICATASTETSFGSGRLIAPGLILTAGHVVDFPSRQAAMRTDWKVYLIGERPESGKWVPHGAELVWRGSGELDLALLRLTDAPSLTPRQRVMFASWGVVGSIDVVEAVGFPEAWSTSAIPTRDYALSGRLRISTQRGPYAWTVAPGDRPDSRDGWKGMSGGTVCKIGPDGLHIFGVLEAVPANFSSGQLSVARLSFAFADILFWNELRTSLGREPRLVPWNGEFTSTQARFYSTIPTLNNRPFVGREDLLEGIGAALRDPSKEAVVVLRGPAGVGKSELAQEFARRNQQAYPGGTFYLDGGSPLLAMELAKLGQTALKLDFPEELKIDAQGEWTLQHLAASAPTLLIYDNVQSETAIEAWLPRAGMACHVVITTLLDRWEVGWVAFDVTPLSRQDSINLIERTVGSSLANRYGTRLTDVAGGLPVQIIPRCSTLAHEEKRGRGGAASLALLDPKAKSSFSGVYQLLSASARLLLHAAARLSPQRIPSDELRSHMVKGVGWSEGEFADYLDACLDFYTLQGVGELRMHQLFAKFVLDIQASDAVATPLAAIVQTQLARMVEVAQELAAHPNRADLAALLMVFLPNPEHWDQGDAKVSVADGEVVGRALLGIGVFEAALPWFERAVAAKEQGDVHGRVDQESLGTSLHYVGYCLSRTGQFEAALPWFERAVAAIRAGRRARPGRSCEPRQPACTRWVTACRAPVSSRRRCLGSSAPSRPKSRATCTAGSIMRASAPACTRWVTACRAPVSSRQRCLGSSAPSPHQSRATCTAGSIRRASAPACIRWVTACRAPVSSRRRCLGSSAPSPHQSRATCTAGSIMRASAPACTSGLLPVEHRSVRGGAALVRARRRRSRAGRRARPGRSCEPRHQPEPGGSLPVEHRSVRGGAALVRARRRRQRAGRRARPGRSCEPRHQPEPGGSLPVEHRSVRGGAALVRARRRRSRAGRRARPGRSGEPRHQPAPGGSLPVEHRSVRGGAALVRARRRRSRAGRRARPGRSNKHRS